MQICVAKNLYVVSVGSKGFVNAFRLKLVINYKLKFGPLFSFCTF